MPRTCKLSRQRLRLYFQSTALFPFFVLMAVFALVANGAPTGDLGSLLKEKRKEKISAMRTALGMDEVTGRIRLPDSYERVELLLEGLQDSDRNVNVTALELLVPSLERIYLPAGILRKRVRPQIIAFIERADRESDKGSRMLARVARRALWHVNFKLLKADQDRLKILKEGLASVADDGGYYRHASARLILSLGGYGAIKLIDDRLGQLRRFDPPSLEYLRLRAVRQLLQLREEGKSSPGNLRATRLLEFYESIQPDSTSSENQLRRWTINEIAKLEIPEAAATLRGIYQDNKRSWTERYFAEDALLQIGALKESEAKLRQKGK